MSMFKSLVRSTGFVATLTASVILLAAIDGASAKSSSNGNSGARQPRLLNNIHPIIYKPSKSDRDHDHDRKSDRDHDHDRKKKADRDRDHCRKSGKCYVGVPVTKPPGPVIGKLPPQPTPGSTTTAGSPGGTTTAGNGPGGTTPKPGGTQPPGTDPGYSAPPNLSGAGGNPNKSPGGPTLKAD
jgi:hypothetical protein